jgi:hypothetical protein
MGAGVELRGRALLWLAAGVLTGAAAVLLTHQEEAVGQTVPDSETTEGGGIVAFPVQLGAAYEVIAVIDAQRRHLCLYQYQAGQPGQARLVLLAARSLTWDLRLEDYNTGSPKPQEVRELLERSHQIRQGQGSPTGEAANPGGEKNGGEGTPAPGNMENGKSK